MPQPENTVMSMAAKVGSGLNSAKRAKAGTKISDCGSAIWPQPENTFGDHNGHSPEAMDRARNCNCG
jgi:hypothetical protein